MDSFSLGAIKDIVEVLGNGATIFLAWLLWRFDRRVYRLEILADIRNGRTDKKETSVSV